MARRGAPTDSIAQRARPRRESTFRAIADPTRRAILDSLAQGERSVSALCEAFEVSQPAISQHLEVLRDAGLVTVRPEGRKRIYALTAGPLREVLDWAARYARFWAERPEAPGAVPDREADAQRKKGRRT